MSIESTQGGVIVYVEDEYDRALGDEIARVAMEPRARHVLVEALKMPANTADFRAREMKACDPPDANADLLPQRTSHVS